MVLTHPVHAMMEDKLAERATDRATIATAASRVLVSLQASISSPCICAFANETGQFSQTESHLAMHRAPGNAASVNGTAGS